MLTAEQAHVIDMLGAVDQLVVQMRMSARRLTDPVLQLELDACADLISAAHRRARASIAMAQEKPMAALMPAQPISVLGLYIEPASRLVTMDGRQLKLSRKPWELLLMMATDPTRVWTKRELLRGVWDTEFIGISRTLDAQASRLRKDLGGYPWVINEWGVGYQLIDPGVLQGGELRALTA